MQWRKSFDIKSVRRFSPDENIDHIEKDEPSSYEKPSSLVEPLIYVFDMNLPTGIPL
jgi:hypothetical protein